MCNVEFEMWESTLSVIDKLVSLVEILILKSNESKIKEGLIVSGGVVTNELDDGNHSNATVLELLCLHRVYLLRVIRELSVAVESEIPRSRSFHLLPSEDLPPANGGTDLEPTKSRNSTKSTHTVGNIVKLKTEVIAKATGEANVLSSYETSHGKHGHTAMLQLCSSILLEGLIINIIGQTERIPKASRGNNTRLVLKSHLQAGPGVNAGHGRKSSH